MQYLTCKCNLIGMLILGIHINFCGIVFWVPKLVSFQYQLQRVYRLDSERSNMLILKSHVCIVHVCAYQTTCVVTVYFTRPAW